MKTKNIIALVSYNPLPSFKRDENGYFMYRGQRVLVCDQIFNPKSRENVKEDDPQFQRVLTLKDEIKRIFIFAGKASSGALEIINLFSTHFQEQKDILYYILCDHDLSAKKGLLESHGILPSQFLTFSDNSFVTGKRCNELPLLKGLCFDYIDS